MLGILFLTIDEDATFRTQGGCGVRRFSSRRSLSALILLLCAVSLYVRAQEPPLRKPEADITGTWLWSRIEADGTERRNFFTFTQDGSSFSGRMEYPWGGYVGLENGVLTHGHIGFQQHGDATTPLYDGTVDGEHMHLTRTENGKSTHMELERIDSRQPMFPPAPPPPPLRVIPANGLARTPPMGWNAWNHFHGNIDDRTVREVAEAMIATGMRDAGYVYVNIDDEWAGERDAKGTIRPNRNFPDMNALADFVHARGMKLGLYSSPGPETCEGHHGSLGFEQQDADTYAAWGADYLKYDWCSAAFVYRDEDMQAVYQKMGEALVRTGRPIVYSLCQYGKANVPQWGTQVGGNLWRTTPDISDNWKSMYWIWTQQQSISQSNKPGGWNDPDMLEIGNGGMSDEEYRTHFSLWAMLSAPLLAGNDPRSMSAATIATLTNREVIAIDQDTLGAPPRRVQQAAGMEVWLKPLANGDVAVLLLNTTEHLAAIDLRWKAIGLGEKRIARNLWSHRYLGETSNIHADIPGHGVRMLRVSE